MRSGYTLRAYASSDKREVLLLAGESFADFGQFDATIEHWLEKPSVATLVATSDDLIVGFITYGYRQVEAEVFGDIIALAVLSEHRGRGIGGELLASAMSFLREGAAAVNARGVQLHVAEGNINARRLFAEHGYLEVRSDGRYPNGDRALLCVNTYLSDGEPSTLT